MQTLYVQVQVPDSADFEAVTRALRDHLAALGEELTVPNLYAAIIADITDEAQRILRKDYYDDVRSIADEFAEQWKSGEFANREDALQWLLDSIDGTQRVIYTSQAMLGLIASDNAGAYLEEFGAEDNA